MSWRTHLERIINDEPRLFRAQTELYVTRLAVAVGLDPRMRILDFGCGLGNGGGHPGSARDFADLVALAARGHVLGPCLRWAPSRLRVHGTYLCPTPGTSPGAAPRPLRGPGSSTSPDWRPSP